MSHPGIPDDIYRGLRRWCAVRRAAHITRDHVRRARVMIHETGEQNFIHKKPAEAGSCASSLTVNQR